MLLFLPAWVGAAPTVTAGTVNTGSAPSDPQTFSYTVDAGSNRIFGLCLTLRNNGSAISLTSVTFGGNAMTAAEAGGTAINQVQTWFYYLINPPSGSQTVSVDYNGANQAQSALVPLSILDADQSTPIRTAVESTGASVDPLVTVTSQAGDLVVDCLTIAGPLATTWSVDSGTQLTNTSVGGGNMGSGSGWEAGASSVDRDWTITGSKSWSMVGVSIKPAAAPATRRPQAPFIFQ